MLRRELAVIVDGCAKFRAFGAICDVTGCVNVFQKRFQDLENVMVNSEICVHETRAVSFLI